MWKAPKDMSDKELTEALEQTTSRLQSVAGHNKARRLEEKRDVLTTEVLRRREVA